MKTLATFLMLLIASVVQAKTLELNFTYPVQDVQWKLHGMLEWNLATSDPLDDQRYLIDYEFHNFLLWIESDGLRYTDQNLNWVIEEEVQATVLPPHRNLQEFQYQSGETELTRRLWLIGVHAPEPNSLLLGLLGLVSIFWIRR